MRPVRKALKALLIAATLGFAVAYIVRTQGTRLGRRSGRGTEAESTVPQGVFGTADTGFDEDTPVVPTPVIRTPVGTAPARPVAPPPYGPAAAPEAEPAVEPGEIGELGGLGEIAELAEVVEIDPDQLTPVAVATGEPERPARTRRPQLVVGGVVVAFVVAAVAVGSMAYNSLAGEDDDKTAPAAATSGQATTPRSSTSSGAMSPLGPQQFQSLGTRSGGTLNHLELAGRRSGVTAEVWVWLPPQYTQDDMRSKNFPVLVVHSAYPGVGANSMLEPTMDLLDELTDGIANGTLPPFVVVAPELTPYQKREIDALADPTKIDTECSDIPGKPAMATFHNEDVREAVAATFRVSTDRDSWGLLGEGAGGLCATKYALQYPQYYAAAASLSGPLKLRSPLWPTAQGVREAQEPNALLAKAPDVRLYLSNATSSANAVRQEATAFKAAAKAPTTVETATASGAAPQQLPAALRFLNRNVSDSAKKAPANSTGAATGATGAASTRRP